MAGDVPSARSDGHQLHARRAFAAQDRARDVEQAPKCDLARAIEISLAAVALGGIKRREVHDGSRLERFEHARLTERAIVENVDVMRRMPVGTQPGRNRCCLSSANEYEGP